MLLALDVGNTQVVVGLFDEQLLLHSWRISTRRGTTADEFTVLLEGMLRKHDTPRESIVASVVPQLTDEIVRAVTSLTDHAPLVVKPGVKTGLKIRTDNPQEVGADRILNAVAAHAIHGGPAVVVDFGTATTLDVVTESGDYLGGIICPGPSIGAEALAARAARLPRVEMSEPPRVVGRNSIDSIRSGVFFGHVAMIDGLLRRVEAELDTQLKVIATGGLASTIGPHLERSPQIEPDLTLQGLRLVYQGNRK